MSTRAAQAHVLPAGWHRSAVDGRRRTSVVVAKQLLRSIHDTGLRPGDPLPSEGALTQQLDIGRGSLREALLILELNGFITVRTGAKGGPVVSDGGAAAFGQMASMHFQHAKVELRELLQARVALEPFVARLAADLHDPGRTSELAAALEESAVVDTSDSRAYIMCANRFHEEIAVLSGNKVLDLFGAAILDLYESRLAGPLSAPQGRTRTMSDHIAIGQAIISGDGVRAEQLMRAHMDAMAEQIELRHTDLLSEVVQWF